MSEMTDRQPGTFLVGAVLGAVVGAAYALLRAPQAGWRTRADLSNQAEATGDLVAHRVETAVATVTDFFGDSHAEPEIDLANPYRGLVVEPAAAPEIVVTQQAAGATG